LSLNASSWTPQKSKVKSREHQNNANIHREPFPESVSEKPEIHADYGGYHRRHVKHDRYLFANSSGNRHLEFSISRRHFHRQAWGCRAADQCVSVGNADWPARGIDRGAEFQTETLPGLVAAPCLARVHLVNLLEF
jgi:hypothetical protein